jgi:hypothetical protein
MHFPYLEDAASWDRQVDEVLWCIWREILARDVFVFSCLRGLTLMPLKFHASRRHKIPKARYAAKNWLAYEASLRQRGEDGATGGAGQGGLRDKPMKRGGGRPSYLLYGILPNC